MPNHSYASSYFQNVFEKQHTLHIDGRKNRHNLYEHRRKLWSMKLQVFEKCKNLPLKIQ